MSTPLPSVSEKPRSVKSYKGKSLLRRYFVLKKEKTLKGNATNDFWASNFSIRWFCSLQHVVRTLFEVCSNTFCAQ